MNDPIPVFNFARWNESAFEEFQNRVISHTSIRHAMDWLLPLLPKDSPIDVIAQDEFSHDLLFPSPTSNDWFVYECT